MATRPVEALLQRDRALAGLSFSFLLDEMANGVGGLEPLDALIVMAVNQANISPLTRDPAARERYGQMQAPAPDHERRRVSINAVANSLGLPFETVRRRIRRLVDADVCDLNSDGVIVPARFLSSPDYVQSVVQGHHRLRRFYYDLRDAELIDELPAAAYAPDQVPIRAAARLLADYVLRTSDGLMREAGNVISTLVLVALLAAALREQGGLLHRPVSAKAIAEHLRLPMETVRRHAAGLAEAGLCARTTSGLVMRPEHLSRPGLRLLVEDNALYVQRLVASLAERGVIDAWNASAGTA